MTRSVDNWAGKTDDTSPPPRVKERIIRRQDGICACGCGQKLGSAAEPIEFDHEQALILGGANDEENLRALRRPCHAVKTREDVRVKAKISRGFKRHFGLNGKKRLVPGSKGTPWKKRLDGTVERRT